MKLTATILLAEFFAFASATWAAQAPLSEEQLRKNADQIVSGTAVEVTSKTEKSKVEKAWGIHRDRVFRIKLKVSEALKGTAVKAGDQIEVVAWRPATRIPPLPGSQGHESIPRKNEKVTLYLKGKEGGVFTPILPNGIVIQEQTD